MTSTFLSPAQEPRSTRVGADELKEEEVDDLGSGSDVAMGEGVSRSSSSLFALATTGTPSSQFNHTYGKRDLPQRLLTFVQAAV
jgi:hypothetical protein